MKIIGCTLLLFGSIALFSGCQTYVTPGEKADLRGIAPAKIEEGFAATPSQAFPAAIAVVRVQGPGYRNYNVDRNGGTYGSGRYAVVTVREVGEEAKLQEVTKLPQVAGIISINRMLLPARLDTEVDLRAAASRLQADMVLMYTFDTSFFDRDSAKPLTVITLGLSPTRRIRVTTTASALLLDTRTGYIYSAYETTEARDVHATSWGARDTADQARRDAERVAFSKLADDFVKTWPQLLDRYSRKT